MNEYELAVILHAIRCQCETGPFTRNPCTNENCNELAIVSGECIFCLVESLNAHVNLESITHFIAGTDMAQKATDDMMRQITEEDDQTTPNTK